MKRLDPSVPVTVTLGVRLTPEQLEQIDAEVDALNATTPGAQASRASVARALIVAALRDLSARRAGVQTPQPPTVTPESTLETEAVSALPRTRTSALEKPQPARVRPTNDPRPDPLRDRFLVLLQTGELSYERAAKLCGCSPQPLRSWAIGRVRDGQRSFASLTETYRERLQRVVDGVASNAQPLKQPSLELAS